MNAAVRRFLLLLPFHYRRPMSISQVMVFSTAYGESGYYICPRCGRTLEREFTAFCDRCGQRLDWRRYEEAQVIRPGQTNPLPFQDLHLQNGYKSVTMTLSSRDKSIFRR